MASRVGAKGRARPLINSGEPLMTALNSGSTNTSSWDGSDETNGIPIFRSVTVWWTPAGRSSNSNRPPSTRMLYTENRAPAFALRASAGFGPLAESAATMLSVL